MHLSNSPVDILAESALKSRTRLEPNSVFRLERKALPQMYWECFIQLGKLVGFLTIVSRLSNSRPRVAPGTVASIARRIHAPNVDASCAVEQKRTL